MAGGDRDHDDGSGAATDLRVHCADRAGVRVRCPAAAGTAVLVLRTLIAGVLAFLIASPVITAISGSVVAKRTSVLPELWFVILGGALVRTLLPGAKRASRALR
jgi:hypothetical protein